MNRNLLLKLTVIAVLTSVFTLLIINNSKAETDVKIDKNAYDAAVKLYENNQVDKAASAFKAVLSPIIGDETEARQLYELGLKAEEAGDLDQAATQYKNALDFILSGGAKYLGISACKKCHLKQYLSWKKTKMAKTFEVLKPGANAESKTKSGFDPKKDYTADPKCLACHTTGYGMPGGYPNPDKKDAAAAKENQGTTCEACHGPGSKYAPIHEDIKDKKRKYSPDELYRAGAYKIDASICTTCHNRRNPTAPADYIFDYDKSKNEDTHANAPLKYRM
jgi:hypothetical protein